MGQKVPAGRTGSVASSSAALIAAAATPARPRGLDHGNSSRADPNDVGVYGGLGPVLPGQQDRSTGHVRGPRQRRSGVVTAPSRRIGLGSPGGPFSLVEGYANAGPDCFWKIAN